MCNRQKIFVGMMGLLFVWISVGCGSKEKVASGSASANQNQEVSKPLLDEFNKGVSFLDVEKYEEAQNVFRNLIIEHPTSQFHLVSMYNLGASYEGLQKCQEAGIAYRKVARASLGKYPRLEAQALFRLSFAYSCLGYDEKAIASLVDAKRRSDVLPEEVAIAEIPARLAATYARIGNKEKAAKYFAEAKLGVQRIKEKNQNRRAIRDILAKTLFLMGRMTPLARRVHIDSLEYLTTLQQLQIYLLEAVELESDKWSPQAAKEIEGAYENIWSIVDQVKVSSKDIETVQQKTKDEKYKIVSEALANLKLLKNDFRPATTDNTLVNDLKKSLDKKEDQFQHYLAENSIQTPLSREAQKREGLRRGGRTEGETKLEKEAKKRTRLPQKGEEQ